jgi:hypothetical protein
LQSLAAYYIRGIAVGVYHLLANPGQPLNQGVMVRDGEDPRGQLADGARMDALIEKLQLSDDQLDSILMVRNNWHGET